MSEWWRSFCEWWDECETLVMWYSLFLFQAVFLLHVVLKH